MDGSSTELGKSIIILTPGFPISETDNNCLPSVQGFVQELAKQIGQHRIFVLSFQYPFNEGCYFWNGIKVYSAGGKNKKGISRFCTYRKIILEAYKIIKNNNVAAIHSLWLTGTTFIGTKLSNKFSIPHIASILGQDAKSSNIYLKFLKLKNIIIVANSDFSAHVYRKTTGRKPNEIIQLGLNLDSYKPINSFNKCYDVIGCGSLSKIKQFDHFIPITLALKKTNPEIKVAIIGGGPTYNKLKIMIEQNNLSKNLLLLGSINNFEILNYISKAKIFLHTSKYEASSHVMLEANYCGLPTVSYSVGYHPTNNLNHVCESIDEMIQQIQLLLKNPSTSNNSTTPTINETVTAYRKLYQF
jgi:glycosyltransferase involved in cell wall biosynthesis